MPGFICGEDLEVSEEDLCSACGAIGEYACDFPIGDGRTCDAVLCSKHAYQVGPNTHFCEFHFREYERWRKDKGYDEALEAIIPFRKDYRMKVEAWERRWRSSTPNR